MEKKIIKAEIRKDSGKRYAKNIRKMGKIPGIFYSKETEPLQFECFQKELKNIEHYESKVVTILLNGKKLTGLIREIQHDPVSDAVLHIDVMGVDLAKKVSVEVPTVVKGTAVGVKTSGGILEHITHKIEIECLAKDIPENIEIDVSELNIGESIHVEDLKIEKAKIISKPELVIVTVVPPIVVIEEVKVEAEEEEEKEPEVVQKEKEKEPEAEKEAKKEKGKEKKK